MGITATLDLSEIRAARKRLQNDLGSGIARSVRTACEEGAEEARSGHAYKDRSGDLTRSIHGELTKATLGEAEGEIVAGGPGIPYAGFVEEGTKAHEIRPKMGRSESGPVRRSQSRGRTLRAKPFLAWQGADGQWHRARIVKHPGTRAYGYMGIAYLKAERVLERELDVAVARAVTDAG